MADYRRLPMAGLGLAALIAAGGCTDARTAPATPASLDPGPTCVKTEDGSACLPLANPAKRVDLTRPSFSDPTAVTNPLFPIGALTQVVQLGSVEGARFRAEVTLLPDTKTIDWDGQQVKTLVSQYVAYLDGRIAEVALDWYAQADDGAVWYFGEDVFNYEDGILADTHGTWVTGKDGPAGMIMPAAPKAGDVYRPENVPGVVFEEVTVTSVGQTGPGPRGPVAGAIVGTELHMDGTYEDKTFAPGYGEFTTGAGGDSETVAVAVPTDALSGPVPAQLAALSTGAAAVFDAAGEEERRGTAAKVLDAWTAYRATGVPPLLDKELSRAVAALEKAEEPQEARQAALDVAQTALDLRMRHEPTPTVDRGRFALWTRQLQLDAAAEEPGDVAGDADTLNRIWHRIRHTADPATATRIDTQLADLQAAAKAKDLPAVAKLAPTLHLP